jgi:hypothetical protein
MLQLEDKKIIKDILIDKIKDVSRAIKHAKKDGGFYRGILNEYEYEKNQLVNALRNLESEVL